MKISPKPRLEPLLIEVGSEEIPARFLAGAQQKLGERLMEILENLRLAPAEAPAPETFSTPRRLVARVPEILFRQPDEQVEIQGPPVRVAFDAEGRPTQAAESFARKNGTTLDQLLRIETPKGDCLVFRRQVHGRPASDVLAEALPDVVLGIPFPKSMYWTSKSGPRFIRPIRWLLAILGEGKLARIIRFEIGGVVCGNLTFGHRVAGPKGLRVQSFEEYVNRLREHQVEIDPGERRKRVDAEVKALLEVQGLKPLHDPALSDWVVHSTEWPCAIAGEFDSRFLHLPREILVTVMRDHQKYFAVENAQGDLQAKFVAVMNLAGDPAGLVRQGHERVLAARFADAEFFWNSDQKIPLRDRLPILERVTYQAKLGTYADKVRRMRILAGQVCGILRVTREGEFKQADADHVSRAVDLSKCDLTTQMVQEFTELQGIVGGLYAAEQGEPEEVANAIYDHYEPAGLEDSNPRTLAGAVVSLSDKIDSVAAGFAAGNAPTGSSDPFGLRRDGNSIIKVLLEFSLSLRLTELLDVAVVDAGIYKLHPQQDAGRLKSEVLEFLLGRLQFYLESVAGLKYDTVRAAIQATREGSEGWDNPLDILHRARALDAVIRGENFEPLARAAKRIKNILVKSATAQDWSAGPVQPELTEEGPERELHQAYQQTSQVVERERANGRYVEALEAISRLRPQVDSFFDRVLVMHENRDIRENRLRILHGLDHLLSGIVNISEIENVGASTLNAAGR